MHVGTTPKKELTTDGNLKAGHKAGQTTPTAGGNEASSAAYALLGRSLHRVGVLLQQSADLTPLIACYHGVLTRAVLRGGAELIAGWARALARAEARLSAAQLATRVAPSAGRS